MRLDEIQSYEDLEVHIRKELARQTAERIPVELKLNEKWFKKLAILISFCMKSEETKEKNKNRLHEGCKKFAIRINNVGVHVIMVS